MKSVSDSSIYFLFYKACLTQPCLHHWPQFENVTWWNDTKKQTAAYWE